MASTHRPAGPIEVDRDSPVPLWAQLHDDITRRLRHGDFVEGFPGEMALVLEYGVSRHTVREALRRLREDRVLISGRGRPTTTAAEEIAQPQGTLYSLFASVEAAGQHQRSVVRALDARADGIVAARMGLEESTPLIYLERLRLADDQPLAWDRVWLPAWLASPLLSADFTETSLYGELETLCDTRLTGGREHVRAAVPTSAERRLLGLSDGVAVLAIDRVGELRGKPVEWRETVVRGDRFTLTTDFSSSHLRHQSNPTVSSGEYTGRSSGPKGRT